MKGLSIHSTNENTWKFHSKVVHSYIGMQNVPISTKTREFYVFILLLRKIQFNARNCDSRNLL